MPTETVTFEIETKELETMTAEPEWETRTRAERGVAPKATQEKRQSDAWIGVSKAHAATRISELRPPSPPGRPARPDARTCSSRGPGRR